jgi:hypothetical protein
MGLDMYLTGERFLWTFPEDGPDAKIAEAIGNLFPELAFGLEDKDRMRIKTVRAEFMYWRKANAIHNWFVQNLQDGKDECQETYVPLEKMVELRDLCQKVLDNPDDAAKLMPTRSGFFFGDTVYDEWYFRDVKATVNRFTAIIDNTDINQWDIYYRSSW